MCQSRGPSCVPSLSSQDAPVRVCVFSAPLLPGCFSPGGLVVFSWSAPDDPVPGTGPTSPDHPVRGCLPLRPGCSSPCWAFWLPPSAYASFVAPSPSCSALLSPSGPLFRPHLSSLVFILSVCAVFGRLWRWVCPFVFLRALRCSSSPRSLLLGVPTFSSLPSILAFSPASNLLCPLLPRLFFHRLCPGPSL